MNRRQSAPGRPASSEEIEWWTQAAASLSALSGIYSSTTPAETISRVNRLISAWPTDDTLPAEGLDSVKSIYKKLNAGVGEIKANSETESKTIDKAMEQVSVLIGLRKATESQYDKRNKRPRAPSPSAVSVPAPQAPPAQARGVAITLPPRNSVGPSPLSREPKARREAWAKQLPLQEGRQVAFHPPPNKNNQNPSTSDPDDNWILAVVDKCINGDKNRYEVHDPEVGPGAPILRYNTTLRSIIPLPDPKAPPGSPSSLAAYKEFPVGSSVLALYPDTSCFYRAEVSATPREMQPSGRTASSHTPAYKVKFEDDDGQEHVIPARWVVEWPGSR